MTVFSVFIEFLVAIAVLVALVSNYLIINKLWKRRMVREVSESVSIAAALLGLFNALPFFVMFLMISPNLAAAAKSAISIITAVVFVLIGSGLWVAEFRQRGFRRLFLRALKLERRESADLLKQIVQPRGAAQILHLLHQLAAVDGRVDPREAEMIREFAREWRLPEPAQGGRDETVDLLTLRKSLDDYLKLHPPATQVAHLRDVLHVMAESDQHVSWQESVALEEIEGVLHQYVAGESAEPALHEVLLVPQSGRQADAVRSLLPGREEKSLRGGRVFSVGRYFSPRYAEWVCQKYIGLGVFATVVPVAEPVPSGQPAMP